MSGILSAFIGRVAGVVTDAYFNLVTLLLPGNGTNGAQNNTFLDSSSNNFTITRNGNTTQGTFSPFSQTGWSNYFDGNGDYLNTASNAAFAFGTGDFTIEAWINPASLTTDTLLCGVDATSGAIFGYSATTVWLGSRSASYDLTATYTIPLNTWTHLAVSRQGTTARIFANGVQIASGTVTNNYAQGQFAVGNYVTANIGVVGYLSNVRVVKGTAVYTSAFTPSTSPLTAITNTSILTCQNNRFIDNSSNGFALTVSGTPSVQAFSPFAPTAAYDATTVGGSGYFDGSGDYLTAAGNAAFAFGTGDFTVAAWVYPTNTLATTVLSSNYNYSSGVGNWSLYFSSGTPATLYFNSSSGNKASTVTTTIPLNAWTHVAYTRVGTTGRFFVNGVQLGGTISDSFNYGGSSGNLFVGQQSDGTGLWYGYMTSIQVLKGTGYSSLPIPTSPATNITNTSLLLNFTNAGITDATAKNVLETVGNAQISTTQSKFGGSSMYFDGTGDVARVISNPNLDFGSGDWTIEFWMYTSNVSTRQDILDRRSSATITGWMLSMNIVTAARLTLYASGLGWPLMTSNTNISANTWTHVALVRNGSSFKIYQNGVEVASATSTSAMSDNNYFLQIGNSIDNVYYNGYIDDLRITKGYARYTANFTPPTAAFALQ